jgi:hypothetical protein
MESGQNPNNILLSKRYSSESIFDIESDIYEAMDDLPCDADDFIEGDFHVVLTFIPYNK